MVGTAEDGTMKAIVIVSLIQIVTNIVLLGYGAASMSHTPVVVAEKPAKPKPKPKPKQEHIAEAAVEHIAIPYVKASVDPVDMRSGMLIWNALRAGNDRFISGKKNLEKHNKPRGSHPNPGAMVLSCTDSRVSPETLFDQDVGDLFVVRVAGNNIDPAGIGSFEYAATHLGAKILVVLGHERCSTIIASLSKKPIPVGNLKALVVETAVAMEGSGSGSGDYEQTRVHRTVESNTRSVASRILSKSPILRARVERGELIIVPAIYDLDTGVIRWLTPPPG